MEWGKDGSLLGIASCQGARPSVRSTSMCWLAFARIVATLLANLRNTVGAHPDLTPGVRRIELSGRGHAPPIGLA
jgi:hypothetical protein